MAPVPSHPAKSSPAPAANPSPLLFPNGSLNNKGYVFTVCILYNGIELEIRITVHGIGGCQF